MIVKQLFKLKSIGGKNKLIYTDHSMLVVINIQELTLKSTTKAVWTTNIIKAFKVIGALV